MRLTYIPNILERQERTSVECDYEYKTVKEHFEQFSTDIENHIAIVNGKTVEWDYIPAQGEEVTFTNKIENAGSIIQGLIGAVMIAVGAWLGQPWLIGMGIGMLVGAAAGALMGMMAPSIGNSAATNSFEDSKTYSWDGIQNIIGEGNVVPVVYGSHRIGGVVIEAFVEGVDGAVNDQKILDVLLAISEGEIDGVDISRSLINKKEVAYYDSVQIETRNGTIGQNPITFFSKIARHYAITGVALKYGSPYIYKTNEQCEFAKVSITFPALFNTNATTGDIEELSCSFSFDIQRYGSNTWSRVATLTATSDSKSDFTIDKTISFGSKDVWLVRITRTTEEFTDVRSQGDSYLKSVEEIEDALVAYNNVALFGIRILATDKISGSMPTITPYVNGIKLRDVRNLNNPASLSSNPANIIYDLLTNKRYGLGYWVNPSKIHIDSFKEFADWCDEIVEYTYWDGATGIYKTATEKRFEVNLVLDKEFQAMEIVNKICGSCRAIPYWQGDKLKIVVDRPKEPSQLFSMGNIIAGTFEEEYFSLANVPNQIESQFLDEDLEFEQNIVSVNDSNRIDEPLNQKTMQLYGLTKKSRVKRETLFAMRRAYACRKKINWGAALDAVVCEVGDIILFQHDTPAYGLSGGRIVDVDDEFFTIDRKVPLEQGKQYSLRIRLKTNEFVVNRFTAEIDGETDKIKIHPDVMSAGKDKLVEIVSSEDGGDLYSFGEVDIDAKPYRILSIAKKEDNTFQLSAEEFNESIHTDADNITIEEIDYSRIGTVSRYELDGSASEPVPIKLADNPPTSVGYYDSPPYVESVSLTELASTVNNTLSISVRIQFTPVSMPSYSLAKISYYSILRTSDYGRSWQEVTRVFSGTNIATDGSVEAGKEYYYIVKPYTDYAKTNTQELDPLWMFKFEITTTGKAPKPASVTNFTAIQNGEQIMFKWDAVANTPTPEYEIRQDSWEFGRPVAKTKDTQYTGYSSKTGQVSFFIKAKSITNEYCDYPTEYVINVALTSQKNIIFSHDDVALNWNGVHHNTFVNYENHLQLSGASGRYVSGYIDLGDVVRSRNIVNYNISAEIGNMSTIDSIEQTWDEYEVQWETDVDSSVINTYHKIATFTEKHAEYIDIIRLADTTTTLNGALPASVSGTPEYDNGTYHKGLKVDYDSGVTYNLSLTDAFSIVFRVSIKDLLISGTVAKFTDGSNVISVVMFENGLFWLWDGSKQLMVQIGISTYSEVIIGIGTTSTPGQLKFFVGNTITGEYASGIDTFSFTKPTQLTL